MRRTLIVVLIIVCMMTASPALAHNKSKSRKHHRHHAITATVKPASMFDFDYSKAAPSAKVEQRHIDAAIAIRAELDKTAMPDVTLFGVDFWAQGLADQEASR